MGNFYVNFSVKKSDPQEVVSVLERMGRSAFVTPAVGGYVTIFDKEADSQDTAEIEKLGIALSQETASPVLAVMNHDDDVLCYWLFENGGMIDHYNSFPEYFSDEDEDDDYQTTLGGGASKLCDAFSVPSATVAVASILHEGDYAFAVERHEAIANALGLPMCGVGMGYEYVARGELPDDVTEDQLIRVG